jgi:Sec7-like guanine-nucleotide exchange factor
VAPFVLYGLHPNIRNHPVAMSYVYVTELALWWAKKSNVRGTSTRTMAQRLTRAVEDELYASKR